MYLSLTRYLLRWPPHRSSQRAAAPTTRPPISKPKGRSPKGADGAPCVWDERDGCWRESDGAPFDPERAAARKKAAQAAAQRARRDGRTPEEARAERDACAAAQRARRDGRTPEEARAERDACAARLRKERGTTPLYDAISLPAGPCEQQLLLDTHGCGAAFSTVNSRRLRTLDEGSALHAECVADTERDMELLCPVNVLDKCRMVTDFVKAKKEAEKLHVCGPCGVCDPSMRYSEPINLANLPPEHWARIPREAYARLLAQPPIEWIRRGDDGTYNERTATGSDNHSRVQIPWHEFFTKFEWGGSAYHVAPEAVEWLADQSGDQRDDAPRIPHIRVCKHCHGCWNRPRGEPLGDATEGWFDDLYCQGAAKNSTACGDDLGRLRHLEEEPYHIDTRVSRLEQLVLAEVRTHYVSYKVRRARHLRHGRDAVRRADPPPPSSPQIKAYEHETQRRRLQGHGMPRDTRCSRARGHHGRAPSIRTLAVIAFPHAPQRFSTVRVVFGLASAFDNDAERESFTKRLASQVGVAAKVVAVGCCEEEAGGLQASAVTIGPLPTAQADDVKAQLVACASDLEGTGKHLKVGVGRIGEPIVQTQRWSFCDAVLHAAVAAVNVTFVGPKSCQTRLERSAMSLFKEDGDLALRPHVLVNWLRFRERRDGEAYTFGGKPLSESYAAVQAMIADFDKRTRNANDMREGDAPTYGILRNAHRIYNTAIERCTEASDIANVRVGAQSATHEAAADDAEADARPADARPADELAPHMMHVAVLDRHDQQQSHVLEGLSSMYRSELPKVTSYVDPGDNRGERTDDPLVLQRGDFALDDYGTPR